MESNKRPARRRGKDWALLFATVAAWTAVCGAYMGHVWPNGPGGLIAATTGILVMVAMLAGDVRWD